MKYREKENLDLTVNRSCRIAPESVAFDLKISILKPLHAKLVTQYYDHTLANKDIVKNGWLRSGILGAIKKKVPKEDLFKN